MMPINVLHLITELSTGGAQMALLKLLRHMNRERFSPSVACFFNGNGRIGSAIAELGISVTDLGMSNKARFDALARLQNLIRSQQPTILHTWMFHANVPGRIIGRMCGVPIIIGSERLGMEGSIRRWADRLTAPMSDRITAVSRHSARFLIDEVGISSTRIVVIPNGIDLTDFDNLPDGAGVRDSMGLTDDESVVLSICRLDNRQKGLNFLLDAWKTVVQRNPDSRLLIAGDGPDRSVLERQSSGCGIADSVVFLGEKVASELFPAADLFVLPSLHEGMPNVVLEAMAAAVPVVATAVGGTPEVVDDGETGILVPPGDPDALARAILRLLNDPEMTMRFRNASRNRIESNFQLSETVRRTEALYQEILVEKGIASTG